MYTSNHTLTTHAKSAKTLPRYNLREVLAPSFARPFRQRSTTSSEAKQSVNSMRNFRIWFPVFELRPCRRARHIVSHVARLFSEVVALGWLAGRRWRTTEASEGGFGKV